jgi:hypothetical protein
MPPRDLLALPNGESVWLNQTEDLILTAPPAPGINPMPREGVECGLSSLSSAR